MKTIIPRELARSDVEAAVDYYAREAGAEVALGFIDALQAAYDLIARHPESGALRYAYELGLPDLRSMSLKRYPYLVFYRDQTEHVDVWRVLHARRDIPQWMQEPDSH
ncbi:type II toxin-antitoxin system RelE/ParE family toxin (plasmid) [Sinorhizobium numidicum]|uniref:Type II toxin-antitoxin system RelE/ParE family toxin n=1 Tax=Sinorhizobium numidicum TaxID=680248 RepID=A0ABY8D9K9_9HYPH|nr:type II toxin-antitoxin system RelE/ParE family toxin [Sinorhizobium numidicum]WEX79740.1 type II toxin-antitoxin system RelE/ParE family toxin [Sinorhizobium numidicum]WEX85693.1 type II toxin-antitoxin system RelE/ParE family toxin [Sinorhizobium numidicum]